MAERDFLQDLTLLKCGEKGFLWDESGWTIVVSLLSIDLGRENFFVCVCMSELLLLVFFVLGATQTQQK